MDVGLREEGVLQREESNIRPRGEVVDMMETYGAAPGHRLCFHFHSTA